MMATIIKTGLFFLSFTGYLLYLMKKYSIRIEFAPAIACAFFSSIMFISGILNIMPVITAILWIVGIRLFMCHAGWARKCAGQRTFIIFLVWLCILAYFGILLKGEHFTDYDCFSHWGTVVQDLLLYDRMPNFQNTLIQFQSYPLGSALWIYYVCKIIGVSEGCYLFSQTIMLISFMLPLCAYIKKHNLYMVVLPIVMTVFALVCNINIRSLLVDTLMPLAGLAAFYIIAYERENAVKTALECCPVYIFLIQVKNSGIFFMLICITYWLILHIKELKNNKKMVYTFFGFDIIFPALSFYLWKTHVALVYVNGETSKHAMSISNYKQIFSDKTPEVIREITHNFFNAVFKFTTWDSESCMRIMFLISGILVTGTLYSYIVNGHIKTYLKTFLGCWAVFLSYAFLTLAMYLFSMPVNEALSLGGFDRYMLSVLVFVFGITVAMVLREWSDRKSMFWVLLPLFLIIVAVLPYRSRLSSLYTKEEFASTMRGQYQKLLSDYNVETKNSYMVYMRENDFGYMYYLSRYILQSTEVSVVLPETIKSNGISLDNKNYLIIWDSDEVIDTFLKENGLESYSGMERIVIQL